MADRSAAVHAKDPHGGTASNIDAATKITSTNDEKTTEAPDSKRVILTCSNSRVTMQNTYRLESKAPFDRDRVGVVLEQIMEEMLTPAQYEPTACSKLAEQVCTEILASVREMNFDRYRYIVIVSIYEKMFQGIASKSNALWDNQRDDSVSYTFSNSSMIAVGVVYGIYYD